MSYLAYLFSVFTKFYSKSSGPKESVVENYTENYAEIMPSEGEKSAEIIPGEGGQSGKSRGVTATAVT